MKFSFEQNANKGLSLLFFIGVLWLTEAIHITITALLVPVLAVLIGMPSVGSNDEVSPITTTKALSTFADPIIFIFLAVLL